ncbi:DedA family protein [Nonomuraea sp. NPDC052265]|uniref:DedA family protein n=1 Tax=Nonomuraea sp. NPDC052265 TaxID=3364374 RepID=UPI0037CBB59F
MFDDLLDTLARQDVAVVLSLVLVFLTLDASVGIGLITPGDGLLLVAGATAGSVPETLALIGTGVLACLLGATGGHWLGRRYGPRLRRSRLGRRVGEERWTRAEQILRRSGWALALAYFLPMVHTLTPAVAGAVGMPYRRFMPWALLGSTAWVSTYIVLGAVAGQVARRDAGLLLPVAGAAVVAMLAITAVVRRVLNGGRAAPRERSAWRRPR